MPQRIPARIELKPAQRKALAALSENGATELTRGAYQELTGMSRSQAAYDLADLVEAGILERVGGGRSTHYRLAQQSDPTHRHWTSDRIRQELERFCAGRKTWPSAREFKRTGRTDLYIAASRYGGIRFWAAELDLPRDGYVSIPRAPLRRFARWSWAASGAAIGALLVGAAVAFVYGSPSRQENLGATRATVVKHTGAAPQRSRATPRRSRAETETKANRAGSRPRAQATGAKGTAVLAARTVSGRTNISASASSEPVVRVARATPSPAAGPTPLPAPRASSSPPSPLTAP
jgi:DNA-binding transcriptional ArsR family regulator